MKYAIGVDYGTLSARAVLVDERGRCLAESVREYLHGVLEEALPTGERLGVDWALQVPGDYREVFIDTVARVVRESGVNPIDITGIGIDFTSCTVLPVLADGTPLCELEAFRHEPHAYVKLWKHHAAQYCADLVNEVAETRNEPWLPFYGSRISPEWTYPKALQIAKESPHVYAAMDMLIEAGDWLVWQLCGVERCSVCNNGYKAQWRAGEGYPSRDFLRALEPVMEDFADTKLARRLYPIGSTAGFLTEEMAAKLGLTTDTAVAVGIIDAHASVPACGIGGPGKLLLVMGTSTCHLLLSEEEKSIPGICGVVRDGILPGYYAYEAGQSCVGDHFAWFVENGVPASYRKEADERGISLHALLREQAEKKRPGESGLLALDWWNGVRSPLMDFDLSGLLVGMTLATRPEDIYRALIEATAFGTRTIVDGFVKGGVAVDELYATGGIARKDPMTMQIYADVCNRSIHVADVGQSGALGAAILGLSAGTGKDIGIVLSEMNFPGNRIYQPFPENARIYEELYAEYKQLTDYFAHTNTVMHRLKELRVRVKA